MSTVTRKMRLGAFLQETGHHIAGWRLAEADASAAFSLEHQVELARTAERGLFDLVFIADSLAVRGAANIEALRRTSRAVGWEPITLLSALAASTSKIGLIGTVTTTYSEPFSLARQFASLDHLSGGRAGWNLVTSNNEAEAQNYGRSAHAEHGDRYNRAEEFIDVVRGLWDSWEDDAFTLDKEKGLFFDPEKLHVLDHTGANFKVRGPLNIARSPQGYPVLVQAGSSEAGRRLAARTAELVFTAQQTLAGAQEFYADVKNLSKAFGRNPDLIKIMPGFFPVVGRTTEEARAKFDALQDLVDPVVGLATLATTMGEVDLSNYDLDGPLPDIPETNGPKGRRQLLIDLAHRENLSIRQLYLRVVAARGHHVVIGSPEEIADEMERWFNQGAADGFNIMPASFPGGLTDFVDLVIPALQRRDLFRRDYEGNTLRDHLGLGRPAGRFEKTLAMARALP
ncbi:LLM class flavin-dependent oxidoreductase [Agrobacterium rhizogenes]|uniref:LLM class flavin-dependent oxidoreductase n=1 Tax=Rhizobium rhizogenes TaxID=359 RepID=UPI0009F649F7|nr:LLM class flavin-dependent oxidoreductase [Rhizobium rhizogenes]NTI52852.1 LLM class flavin-dependent oxidoreductase [Rhizobium rhizogenes]NTI98225.1 LLM class flavin-dependent oxidoreductase [Rhizobium rhizogenes]NTJ60648.1 LLM class flavin-dependent oxidoreductase [Rhizobium rhizogenes]